MYQPGSSGGTTGSDGRHRLDLYAHLWPRCVCCDTHTAALACGHQVACADVIQAVLEERRPGQTTGYVGGALMAVAGDQEDMRARAERVSAADAAACRRGLQDARHEEARGR